FVLALFDRAAGLGRALPKPVRRAIVPDMDAAPFPKAPVIPYGKPVHDRLRLEIARGCGRGCRFCQAGMIYRPYREKSAGLLLEQAQQGLACTGYQDLSLLSLSTGDYCRIEPLVGSMMARFGPDRTAISLPSMRADTLSPSLMEQIRSVRKTGFTIAPEAGTQRLRNIINKNITEKDISDTVLAAGNAGWRLIKLYFMVGLPFETLEDVSGIVELVKGLKKMSGRRQDISVSVGVFVPKAHTPFQWAAQVGVDEAWERIHLVRDSLKMPGVKVKWQNPRTSIMEGALARGGREMASVVETAWKNGCRLDGWSEHFNFEAWLDALTQNGVSIADITRARDIDEPLPWDMIDCRVDKGFLLEEWKRAAEGILTPACQQSCSACGVCDFEKIEVKTSPDLPKAAPAPITEPGPQNPGKFRVHYSKTGKARYLAHLETVTVFLRALRRIGAPLAYSQGFHPMPAIAFDQALPVLVESSDEHFTVTLTDDAAGKNLAGRLNSELPEGLDILFCEQVLPNQEKKPLLKAVYHIDCAPGALRPDAVAAFNSAGSFEVEKQSHKGKSRLLDLKLIVDKMEILSGTQIVLELCPSDGNSMKPDLVLQAAGAVPNASKDIIRIVKSPGLPVKVTDHDKGIDNK
ncbi:MAG: TIGR03936 family radical SAM-associated protein, partial [Desulfatibacillaceae bacterium]|nr:TIGR03936 family radical SAM-associated protein [Desulfatibacillaceae bacterium]